MKYDRTLSDVAEIFHDIITAAERYRKRIRKGTLPKWHFESYCFHAEYPLGFENYRLLTGSFIRELEFLPLTAFSEFVCRFFVSESISFVSSGIKEQWRGTKTTYRWLRKFCLTNHNISIKSKSRRGFASYAEKNPEHRRKLQNFIVTMSDDPIFSTKTSRSPLYFTITKHFSTRAQHCECTLIFEWCACAHPQEE